MIQIKTIIATNLKPLFISALVMLYVLSGVSGLIHSISVVHVECAEHGEVLSLSLLDDSEHETDRLAGLYSDSTSGEHSDGCLVDALEFTTSFSECSQLLSWPIDLQSPLRPVSLEIKIGISRLYLAPKTSPPTSTV